MSQPSDPPAVLNPIRRSLRDYHFARLQKEAPRAKVRVHIIVGTRPELIKMAPVIQEFRASPHFDTKVVNTGQHVELVDRLFQNFGIIPDFDCELLLKGQALPSLYARALERFHGVVERERPDLILVQGDTASAAAAAMVGFLHSIPVGHVEAGLRTHNLYSPFPEEFNRVTISQIATFHFAPTQSAVRNLLAEGFAPSDIDMVGNTIVDALQQVLAQAREFASAEVRDFFEKYAGRKKILLTLHRREHSDEGLNEIFRVLGELAREFADETAILYPVHFTPAIRAKARACFGDTPNLSLVEPIDYFEFVSILKNVDLIVSDSGGIQEESVALRKPILILRDTSERMEVVEAGLGFLVGNNLPLLREKFAEWVTHGHDVPENDLLRSNPYGTGDAAKKIRGIVERFFDGASRHE